MTKETLKNIREDGIPVSNGEPETSLTEDNFVEPYDEFEDIRRKQPDWYDFF